MQKEKKSGWSAGRQATHCFALASCLVVSLLQLAWQTTVFSSGHREDQATEPSGCNRREGIEHLEDYHPSLLPPNGSGRYFLGGGRGGMQVFSHVCLDEDPWNLYTYGNKFKSRSRMGWDILDWSKNKSIGDWSVDRQRSTYIPGDTLFFVNLYGGNPAHCLNDQIFSLFYQENVTGFASYVRGLGFPDKDRKKSFMKHCDMEEDWCCRALQLSRMIPKHVAPLSPDPFKNTTIMCFERLMMPFFGMKRFTSTPEGVRELQKRVLDYGNLQSKPWAGGKRDGPTPILFYDRHGTYRRRYNNSQAFVDILRKKYNVRVHHIGPEWEALGPPAQAALFNTYQYIIAPHGAHLANLIYSRPGTKVAELICEIDVDAPKQNRSSHPPPANSSRTTHPEWYGLPPPKLQATDFFTSWTHMVGIDHYMYVEKDGCSLDANGTLHWMYSPQNFNVDAAGFADYVAVRFGLKRKH